MAPASSRPSALIKRKYRLNLPSSVACPSPRGNPFGPLFLPFHFGVFVFAWIIRQTSPAEQPICNYYAHSRLNAGTVQFQGPPRFSPGTERRHQLPTHSVLDELNACREGRFIFSLSPHRETPESVHFRSPGHRPQCGVKGLRVGGFPFSPERTSRLLHQRGHVLQNGRILRA